MGTDEPTVRTCRLRNAAPERLDELVERNLARLQGALRWNADHGIRFFRIHSGTVPFASHPEVGHDWAHRFEEELAEVGALLDELGVRVTMHPGPYTVLNSPDDEVVERARAELAYHARFLEALDRGPEAKVVVHVGGRYDDREAAADRFVDEARALPEAVRRHLVVENDEDVYGVDAALDLARRADLPAVLDHLHHRLHSSERPFGEALAEATSTWDDEDGVPVVHLSSASGKGGGHHAEAVDPADALDLAEAARGHGPFDVMLEAKGKERALETLRDELATEAAP